LEQHFYPPSSSTQASGELLVCAAMAGVGDNDLGQNSREMNYVKGLTEATLVQKGTFAEAYAKGTQRIQGRTKGATQMMHLEGEETTEGNLSIPAATMIFMLDVIGPGLVGVAFVASNAGIAPFFLFMFISASLMIWGLDLLQAAGLMAGIKNYEAVGVLSIGKSGLFITSLAIAGECYGALIAYFVLIANTFPALPAYFGYPDFPPTAILVAVTVVFIFPLTCLKSLDALEFTTWYSTGVFVVVMFANAYNAFFDDWYREGGLTVGVRVPDNMDISSSEYYGLTHKTRMVTACSEEPLKALASTTLDLFGNIPTLIFAMSCMPSALPVFNELADGQLSSIKVANRISIYGSASLYCCVAVFGYMMTSANTLSNNLLNMRHCICFEYDGNDDCSSSCVAGQVACADSELLGTLINVGFGFAIVAGYATMQYVLRRSIVTVFWGETADFSWPAHIGIAVGNVLVTLLLAILAGDVEVVFNWAGAVAVPLLAFVLPGLYFRMQLKGKSRCPEDPSLKRNMANVLLSLGALLMIGGTILELFA
jgi:amino acid permease